MSDQPQKNRSKTFLKRLELFEPAWLVVRTFKCAKRIFHQFSRLSNFDQTTSLRCV